MILKTTDACSQSLDNQLGYLLRHICMVEEGIGIMIVKKRVIVTFVFSVVCFSPML